MSHDHSSSRSTRSRQNARRFVLWCQLALVLGVVVLVTSQLAAQPGPSLLGKAGELAGQVPLLNNLAELGKAGFEAATGRPSSEAGAVIQEKASQVESGIRLAAPSKEELEASETSEQRNARKVREKEAERAAKAEQEAKAAKEADRQARVKAEEARLKDLGYDLFNKAGSEQDNFNKMFDAALMHPAEWLKMQAEQDHWEETHPNSTLVPEEEPAAPAEEPQPETPAPAAPAPATPAPATPAPDPMEAIIQQIIDAANADRRQNIEEALEEVVAEVVPEAPPPVTPPVTPPPVEPENPPTEAETDAAVDLIMALLSEDLPPDEMQPSRPTTRLQTISTDQMAELRAQAQQNRIDDATRSRAEAINADLDRIEAQNEAARRMRYEQQMADAQRASRQPMQVPTYDQARRGYSSGHGQSWNSGQGYQRAQNMGRAIQYGLRAAQSWGAFGGGGGGGHHSGGLIHGS